MIVWLAMRYKPMEILGIYTSEAKAVDACTRNVDMVGPVELDAVAVDEPIEWTRAYYPIAQKEAIDAAQNI